MMAVRLKNKIVLNTKPERKRSVFLDKNFVFLLLLQKIFEVLELNYESKLAYTISEMDNIYMELKYDDDVSYLMDYIAACKN